MDDFKLNFTGIGVAKAGTTWLARCLAEHPQVCFAISKETNFFLLHNILSTFPVRNRFFTTSHFAEGLDWYRQQFQNHQPGQLYGEYTNTYLADPESARLLHAHNPALKLLCCFRNPVDVLYTGYDQVNRSQPLPATLEATLEKYPELLRYGYYHANLQPFLARFPREQFHFMVYDDIRQDAAGVYRDVCRFLGIDETFQPPSLNRRMNPRTVLRSKTVRNVRAALSAISTATPWLRRIRQSLFRHGIGLWVQKLFRMNEKPGQIPPLAPETRARLADLYRADVMQLGALLGRDLSAWVNPSPPTDAAGATPARP